MNFGLPCLLGAENDNAKILRRGVQKRSLSSQPTPQLCCILRSEARIRRGDLVHTLFGLMAVRNMKAACWVPWEMEPAGSMGQSSSSVHRRAAPIATKLRVKYTVFNSPVPNMRLIDVDQAIQQVIHLTAEFNGVDIKQLSLGRCVLAADGRLNSCSDSGNGLFVCSKSGAARPPAPPADRSAPSTSTVPSSGSSFLSPDPPLWPRPRAASDSVRDFMGLEKSRTSGSVPLGPLICLKKHQHGT
jgi:hypothetical protein